MNSGGLANRSAAPAGTPSELFLLFWQFWHDRQRRANYQAPTLNG